MDSTFIHDQADTTHGLSPAQMFGRSLLYNLADQLAPQTEVWMVTAGVQHTSGLEIAANDQTVLTHRPMSGCTTLVVSLALILKSGWSGVHSTYKHGSV